MDEYNIKEFLKNIRLNETRMSFIMGLVVLFGSFVFLSRYVGAWRNRGAQLVVTPSPIAEVVLTSLPKSGEEVTLPTKYQVQKGDSTWTIAEAFYGSGFNYVDIEQANGLKKEQQLNNAQILIIPQAEKRTPEPTK